jgi:hypothetical protein
MLKIDSASMNKSATPIEAHIVLESKVFPDLRAERHDLRLVPSRLELTEIDISHQGANQGSSFLVANTVLNNTPLDDFWCYHLSNRGEILAGSTGVSNSDNPHRHH